MSDALVCNGCGTVLVLDSPNGREDVNGEKAAWLTINLGDVTGWDACTRSCAVKLLADDGPIRPVADAWLETVAEIARAIRDEEGDER